MAFKPLGNLLTQQLRRTGLERNVQTARALEIANTVLNELFGEQTTESSARAVALKHGKLQIAAIHSAFRYEIHQRGGEIKQRINEELGVTLIKQVQAVI